MQKKMNSDGELHATILIVLLSVILMLTAFVGYQNKIYSESVLTITVVADTTLINEALDFHKVDTVFYSKREGFYFYHGSQVWKLFNWEFNEKKKKEMLNEK